MFSKITVPVGSDSNCSLTVHTTGPTISVRHGVPELGVGHHIGTKKSLPLFLSLYLLNPPLWLIRDRDRI